MLAPLGGLTVGTIARNWSDMKATARKRTEPQWQSRPAREAEPHLWLIVDNPDAKGPTDRKAARFVKHAQRLRETGHHNDVVAFCNQAIKLQPDHSGAYFFLSYALYSLGRFDEAIAAHRRLIELKADFWQAHVELGGRLASIGRLDEAIPCLERGVELAPSNAWAHIFLAKALLEAERFGEAIKSCVNAISIEPDEVMFRGLLDDILDECLPRVKLETVDTVAARIKAAAELLSTVYPAERVGKALRDLAAEAGRELTDRASDDTRLGRLQARYEKRLREIELPEGGFRTITQLKAADRLSSTFSDLQEVHRNAGLPVIEKPEPVKKAEAMASAYRRSHDKNGAPTPVRRPGRPRRGEQSIPPPP